MSSAIGGAVRLFAGGRRSCTSRPRWREWRRCGRAHRVIGEIGEYPVGRSCESGLPWLAGRCNCPSSCWKSFGNPSFPREAIWPCRAGSHRISTQRGAKRGVVSKSGQRGGEFAIRLRVVERHPGAVDLPHQIGVGTVLELLDHRFDHGLFHLERIEHRPVA